MDKLTLRANDRSSYIVKTSFTDETGAAVTPTSATWTLTDKFNNIINERDQVNIGTLSSTVYIALSGDDLVYMEGIVRYLIVEGFYLCFATGTLLPVNNTAWFTIEDTPTV